MAFSQKILTAQISLDSGSFSGGGNTLSISGLRMTVQGSIATADGMHQLTDCCIYGLSLSQMNQLTVAGSSFAAGQANVRNTISIQGGEVVNGKTSNMFTVFEGNIMFAFPDMNNMPQVCFRIVHANPAHLVNKMKTPPTTQSGSVNGSDLLKKLAGVAGLKYEGNGVNVILSNPYLHGAVHSQIKQACEAMGCLHLIDRGTLAVWPASGSRQGGSTPVISAKTGMIGYPMFQQNMVIVNVLYNPSINCGQKVQIQSDLTAANGIVTVGQIEYDLESLVPRGRWMMTLQCKPEPGFTSSGTN